MSPAFSFLYPCPYRYRSFFISLLIIGLSLFSAESPFAQTADSPNKTQPAPPPNSPLPHEAVNRFFASLAQNQIDDAYRTLLKDSILLDRPGEAETIKTKTQKALDNYGSIRRYETLNEASIGTSLRRITCLSLNEDFPLRWRFYFYDGSTGWKLVDLRVDDALVEMFEESGKLPATSAKKPKTP